MRATFSNLLSTGIAHALAIPKPQKLIGFDPAPGSENRFFGFVVGNLVFSFLIPGAITMRANELTLKDFYTLAPLRGGVIVQVLERTTRKKSGRPIFKCRIVQAPIEADEGKVVELTASQLEWRRDIEPGFYATDKGVAKIEDVYAEFWFGSEGGTSLHARSLGKKLTPTEVEDIEAQREQAAKEHKAGVKAIRSTYPWLSRQKHEAGL